MMRRFLLILGLMFFALDASPAYAQSIDLGEIIPQGDNSVSARMIQIIIVVTVLSIAPGLLIMVTCFTRFVIALSFLRSGLGLQTTPANLILVSLALFMTFYVMAPTFDEAWKNGLKPFVENQISEQEAFSRPQASSNRQSERKTAL